MKDGNKKMLWPKNRFLPLRVNFLHFRKFTLRYYTGWPRKNATLTINNFKKTRDRIKKVVCIIAYKILFPARWPKIVNFDEGVLILWPFFWGNVIFKICPSISKVTIYVPKISIVWLPRVKCLLLLWKAKPAWIKRSIHYVTLQYYNPGELLKEIPPYLKQKEHILKMTLLQKNGSRIKTPSSKSLILVSFCRKNNILLINALTNLISPWFLWN